MNIKILGYKMSSKSQTVIAGHTLELGKSKTCKVRVYSRNSGVLLASKYSDQSGYYKVYLPSDSSFTVIAIDPNKQFNAVIQDNVVPK